MIENIACCYHKIDFDGVCSAAIVCHYHDGELSMYPLDYGLDIPWEVLGRFDRVYVVDYMLKPIERFIDLAKDTEVVWIDHHVTNLTDAIQSTTLTAMNGIRQLEVGACELTWWHLYQSTPIPDAVRYLGRWDVWDHEDIKTVRFQYGLKACRNIMEPRDITWQLLLNDEEHGKQRTLEIIEDGEPIERYAQAIHRHHIHRYGKSRYLPMTGCQALIINSTFHGSQMFDRYKASWLKAGVLYNWDPEAGRWSVRLYGLTSDIDVSVIARAHGGGGHPGAAGFMATTDQIKELIGDW